MILLADMLVTRDHVPHDYARARALYEGARAVAAERGPRWAAMTDAFLKDRLAELDKIDAGRPFLRRRVPPPAVRAAREPGARSGGAGARAGRARKRRRTPPRAWRASVPTVAPEEALADAEDGPLRYAPGAPPRGLIVDADTGGFVYVTARGAPAARPGRTSPRGSCRRIHLDFATTRDQAERLPRTGLGTLVVVDGAGRPLGTGWAFPWSAGRTSMAVRGRQELDEDCPFGAAPPDGGRGRLRPQRRPQPRCARRRDPRGGAARSSCA